jgi:hypothetical protein
MTWLIVTELWGGLARISTKVPQLNYVASECAGRRQRLLLMRSHALIYGLMKNRQFLMGNEFDRVQPHLYNAPFICESS